jgi:serine O-acetyltransferase
MIISDIKYYYKISGIEAVLDFGLWAIIIYRYGHFLSKSRYKHLNPFWFLYLILYFFQILFLKIEIPPSVVIGKRFFLPHPFGIIIGSKTVIGNDVKVGPWAVIGHNFDHKNPVIKDRCYIGPHACILGGIIIGSDCIIGASAVVTSDVANRSVVYQAVQIKSNKRVS